MQFAWLAARALLGAALCLQPDLVSRSAFTHPHNMSLWYTYAHCEDDYHILLNAADGALLPEAQCLQALQNMQKWNAKNLATAQKHLQTAQSELASIQNMKCRENEAIPGFHPDVNRRLLGPLPPRPVQVG